MYIKNLLRKLLLFTTISLIILITAFVIKNKNRLPKSIVEELVKTGIDISIKNIHLIEEKEGRKQWELNADKAEVINAEGITRLANIRMNIFQNNGKELAVSAKNGTIQNDNKDIELEGNIIISNQQGYTLKTEKLHWDLKQNKMNTKDKINIVSADLDITGKGMSVDMKKEIIEIHDSVRVMYQNKKNQKKTSIKSNE